MKTLVIILLTGLTAWAAPSGFQQTDTLKYGLVGWWTLNDGSGTNSLDYSGYGNTGTTTNSLGWTNGVIGGGKYFDATSEIIITNNNTSIFHMPNFTLCAWVKKNHSSATSMGVISKGQNVEYELFFYSGDSLAVAAKLVGTWTGTPATGTPIPTNVWVHIAGSYNGAAFKLYTNGVEDVSQRTAASGAVAQVGNLITIGSTQNTVSPPTDPFIGSMDEVRIYRRALTDAEIFRLSRKISSQD